jgi:hypothetical protein
MEDLTNKQLKDLIRGYKKEKCPAFSKEKKEGLIKIVKTLGLDITLIPIKKKEKKENIKLKVEDKKPVPPKESNIFLKKIEKSFGKDKNVLGLLTQILNNYIKEGKINDDKSMKKNRAYNQLRKIFREFLISGRGSSSGFGGTSIYSREFKREVKRFTDDIDITRKDFKKYFNIDLVKEDKKSDPPKKPDKPDMDKPLKDDDVPKIKKIEPVKEPKIFRGITLTPEKIENYKSKGNESWVASQSNQLIVYEYILDKHKNDCIPIIKSIQGKDAILQLHINQAHKKPTGKNKDNITFSWNREGRSYQNALPKDITNAVKKLRECKKRFVPLPFNFSYKYSDKSHTAHANMIILDLEKNTAEHLEPHGNEFRGREKLKGLDFMIENELPKIFKKWGFKYSNPNESCPYVKGLQSISYNITGGTDINRNIELDIFDNFTQEQNGLCSLWSFILLDLRLSNPDYTIQDILKIVLKKLDFEKFKTNVLQDFKKSYKSFEEDNVGGKWKDIEEYNERLFKMWYEKDNIKLNDLFFMYAITFAQEAFSNYINDLLKLMEKEADKNDMENFMKFIEDNNINPFKLMWIFHKDDKKIELKTNDYVVENPNGLKTEEFYRNVEPKLKEIVFDNLLNKTTIDVVKQEPKEPKKMKKNNVMEDVNKKNALADKLKDDLERLIEKKTFQEIQNYQFNKIENKFVKSVIKMYPAYKDILKNNSESSENTLLLFIDYIEENFDFDNMIKIYRKFIKKLKE